MSAPMTLAVASNNAHKIREFQMMLGDRFTLVPMRSLGVNEDIEETGTTFEENALLKARYVFARTGLPSLADDSGLMVDALQGQPGIYSARFCGAHGDDAANNRLLLEKLLGVPKPRTARYAAAVALVRPELPDLVRIGTCEGEILTEYRGTGGFGYDPLFLCELGKTFAELTPEEKNSISHRRRAIEAVLTALREEERA